MDIRLSDEMCKLRSKVIDKVCSSHEGNLPRRKLWVSLGPKNLDSKQWNQFLQGGNRSLKPVPITQKMFLEEIN